MNCDSLLFDMDGTLWDAVDSYAEVWNRTFDELGIGHGHVDRTILAGMMGQHLEDITRALCGGSEAPEGFLKALERNEELMMPSLGGRLYAGVAETIPALADRYPLFIVSNSGPKGVDNFLDYTGLRPYFKDSLTHGGTGLDKGQNIKVLVDCYKLKEPWYVGDTLSDSESARYAGTGMIWASYGFGHDVPADFVLRKFTDLPGLLGIKKND